VPTGHPGMAAMKSVPAKQVRSVASAVSGMRRVDCVRMVEDARPRFFVVGVGHRFPVEREVSPAVASALLETFPCRYERRPHERKAG
jgi:hypothetical protein